MREEVLFKFFLKTGSMQQKVLAVIDIYSELYYILLFLTKNDHFLLHYFTHSMKNNLHLILHTCKIRCKLFFIFLLEMETEGTAKIHVMISTGCLHSNGTDCNFNLHVKNI